MEQWAEVAEARENQSSCSRRFLKQDDEGIVANPKLYRRSTWKLLKALDHALKLTTCKGLEVGMQKDSGLKFLSESAQAICRPYMSKVPRGLAVVADQAGNGLSAINFRTKTCRINGCRPMIIA